MITDTAAISAARMSHTYEQAERMFRDGRIGYRTWLWYQFFWVWTAARFSNLANASYLQERAHERLGPDGYSRRFARVIALRARLQSAN